MAGVEAPTGASVMAPSGGNGGQDKDGATEAAVPVAGTGSNAIPYTVASVLDSVAASLKKTRKTWTDAEKKAVLDLMQHAGSKQKTINELQRRYGTAFATISRKTLKQWQKRAEEAASSTNGDSFSINKKRGRRTCNGFEDELLSRLRGKKLNDGSAQASYTYSSVIQTANELRNEPDFKDDDAVKKLKFSCTWVRSFMDRYAINQSLEPAPTPRRGRPPGGRQEAQGASSGKGRKRVEDAPIGRGSNGAGKAAPVPDRAAEKIRRLETQVEMLRRQLEDERQRNVSLEQRCTFLDQQLLAQGATHMPSATPQMHRELGASQYSLWQNLGVGHHSGAMGGVYQMNT
jgi:hypothetical protein